MHLLIGHVCLSCVDNLLSVDSSMEAWRDMHFCGIQVDSTIYSTPGCTMNPGSTYSL